MAARKVTNADLDEKLDAQSVALARLEVKVDNACRVLEKYDDRITHLERRDAIGNIITGILASFATIFSIINGK